MLFCNDYLFATLGFILVHRASSFGVLLSDASLDSLSLPQVTSMKSLDLWSMPSVDASDLKALVSTVDTSSLGIEGLSTEALAGIAAAVVLVGAAVASSSSSSSSPSAASSSNTSSPAPPKRSPVIPKPDLSIPYDAAARLAYDEWCKANEKTSNQAAYEAFRDVFETKAIAEATSKKKSRDLQNFENQAPRPVPERKITSKPKPRSAVKETPFFFAE